MPSGFLGSLRNGLPKSEIFVLLLRCSRPKLSIRGADRKDRSYGNENVCKYGGFGLVSCNWPLSNLPKYPFWYQFTISYLVHSFTLLLSWSLRKVVKTNPETLIRLKNNNKVLEIFEYLLTTEQVEIRIIAMNIERTRMSSVRVLLFYFIILFYFFNYSYFICNTMIEITSNIRKAQKRSGEKT